MNEITQVMAAFTAIFGIYKTTSDVYVANSSRKRDEYRFTKEYITDLTKEENPEHDYVLERGFQVLEKKPYCTKEIRFLLSMKNPVRMISLRKCGIGFIEYQESSNDYKWLSKNPDGFFHRNSEKWYFLRYLVAASLIAFPLSFKGLALFDSNPVTISILLLALALVAFSGILKQTDFKATKDFMDILQSQKDK